MAAEKTSITKIGVNLALIVIFFILLMIRGASYSK
ncbi:YjcZ family sporulation protein [Priestia megaterium]|jgi:uncharacterized protein (TIGR01732 family)|nr:YjcZ family sporulation protein [Priestia megaterium]